MNYIKELNAFRNFQFMHQLPSGTVATWHALMTINNLAGWKKRFNAPNSTVQALAGLSKQGVAQARKQLVDYHLIDYEKGRYGKAPIYQMMSLANPATEAVNPFMNQLPDMYVSGSVDEGVYDLVDQKEDPEFPVLKKKQKQKSSSRAAALENLYNHYEANIQKLRPQTKEMLYAWSEKLSSELVMKAIEYAVKLDGKTFKYVEKILQDWAAADLQTVAQADAHEEEKEKRRDTRRFRYHHLEHRDPDVFEYLLKGGDVS